VTELGAEPEKPPVLEDVAPPLTEEVLEPAEPDPELALTELEPALDAVELCDRASAGSWPLTRITVISSQVAANSATAPMITRLRIIRTRSKRACRIATACAWVMAEMIRPARIRRVRSR